MYAKFPGFVLALILGAPLAAAAAPAPVDQYLADGRIAEGLEAYAKPDNDAERFSLAVLQVCDGVQKFSVRFNELGMRADSPLMFLPFLRIAVPQSGPPSREPATPEKVAYVFDSLQRSLRDANRTLAALEGEEFGVPIRLSKLRLDFNGDLVVDDSELLLTSLADLMGQRPSPSDLELLVRFDLADAVWLKGYTHFLSGLLDILMAYDWRPVWDQCAHLLLHYPQPNPSFGRWAGPDQGVSQWADLIAAVHDMRLELKDKKAWPRARDEFRAMIASSRACWDLVLIETDNEAEWLPSPAQTGPQGATISQDQIDAWLRVLDELEAVAAGEKLLPHWRVRPGAGINIDKLVDSPPELDIVLWIHGAAMIPFLEDGPVSDSETWEMLTEPFGPGFLRFAIWSN